MDKILAIIPARSGSKRLPGKNKKLLGGKPLIMWSVEIARKIPQIGTVLVSTDDEEIAQICRNGGATVPWIRPPELATDTATTVDVVLHALDWYEKNNDTPDAVLLLQPTSPFRKEDTLIKGIEIFKTLQCSVVGVSPCHDHPMWSLKIENGQLQPFMKKNGLEMRSQDLPAAYTVNGAFYMISPHQLKRERKFSIVEAIPLLMKSIEESIDIDDEFDWFIAESILEFSKFKNRNKYVTD